MIKFQIKLPDGKVIDDDQDFESIQDAIDFCTKYDYDILVTVVEDGSIRKELDDLIEKDDFFGAREYYLYHNMVKAKLHNRDIYKHLDLIDCYGGLRAEASRLGITTYDFLRCLEGMCHKGEAYEIPESTYHII